MPDFGKVGPGTPIGKSPILSAGWVNSVSDATARFVREQASSEATGEKPNLNTKFAIVRVKNMAGEALLRGHCVQLGDYRFDDIKPHALWFEADLPAAPLSRKIAILRSAVKSGYAGQVDAQMLGVCTAWVDVTSTSHTHANPEDGEKVLKSGGGGFAQILSPLTTTGEQEVAVLIGGGGSTFQLAQVYGGGITAATDNLLANWGSGNVKFMDKATGVLDSSPTAVVNPTQAAYVEDAQLIIDVSTNPPQVYNGTCSAKTWI